MAKNRTTLKDIAKELGTTITTVSKALKNYPDISNETKKAVKKMAKKMNYQPDLRALALKKNKSNTIGVIIPEVVHFFFSNVIEGIMKYTEEKGYRVLITLSNNSIAQEKKQVKLLFNTKVDGVIVSLANETKNAKHFNILKEYEIPIVMFDKVNDIFQCNKVKIDDKYSAYMATEHLIKKGCKKIAHIRGPKNPSNAIARFLGYKEALQENGMEFNPDWVKECEEVNFEEGFNYTMELLKSKNRPDGIFAVTDQVAVGAIRAAQELGIKIPQELKIIGFSDSQIAQIIKPSLTTIHQPGYEIGERAAKLLIEEIELRETDEEHSVDFRQIILDTYLIERETA